jgi:hypothetical protein
MSDFIFAILFRLIKFCYAAGVGVAICAIGLELLCDVFGRCPVANPLGLVWVSVALIAAAVVFMLLADRV